MKNYILGVFIIAITTVFSSCSKDEPNDSPTPINLLAPIATAATDIQEGQFQANWETVEGAIFYRVQITVWDSLYFMDYPIETSADSLVITGQVCNYPHYYRVQAFDYKNNSSPYSNIISLASRPYPPIAYNASNITDSSFIANFADYGGEIYYYLVYVSTSDFPNDGSDMVPGFNGKSIPSNKKNVTVTGLQANTTYYFAFKSAGFNISKLSNSIKVVTKPVVNI
ncbi:MAG: hypothetical protein KAG64_00885 [Bacteroidales bacterium]|nr:hypothetical protein [Bacteroidales bacterium]